MNPVTDPKASAYVAHLNRYSACMAFLRQAEEWMHSSAQAALLLLQPLPDEVLHPLVEMIYQDQRLEVNTKLAERNVAFRAALRAAYDYDRNPSEDNLYLLEQLIEHVRK